ncbi:hypothetical protein CHZ71_003398 [Escherichia coli]|nr:hypothetical protein [Escherichia coli]EHI0300815.1 hypothetical protein [Escherichia coli]
MSLIIYGFGSFFNGSETFNDIDLLIVHSSNSYDSCLEAIALKREILSRISNADVTMLSKSEEIQFNFVENAKAFPLGSYTEKKKEDVVSDLKLKLCYWQLSFCNQ